MKRFGYVFVVVLVLISCKNKQVVVDPNTLPKDISQKPPRNMEGLTNEQIIALEEANIKRLHAEIDSLITAKDCTSSHEWRISALGSKPCGGPASYIAYHKDVEELILPKIREYTTTEADYNKRRELFSDCAIEPQPSGVVCENNKPVLKYENSTSR